VVDVRTTLGGPEKGKPGRALHLIGSKPTDWHPRSLAQPRLVGQRAARAATPYSPELPRSTCLGDGIVNIELRVSKSQLAGTAYTH
jgi:hypothetical protein